MFDLLPGEVDRREAGPQHQVYPTSAILLEGRPPVVAVREPTVEFDDQPVLRKVGVNPLAADVHVEQRHRQPMALDHAHELALELGAGGLGLALADQLADGTRAPVERVASRDITQLPDGQVVAVAKLVHHSAQLFRPQLRCEVERGPCRAGHPQPLHGADIAHDQRL